jgi:anti-anti-sigma factor
MQVSTRTINNTAQIRLSGRFDFNAHKDFRSSYDGALKESAVNELELDFGAVDYLDSSALGMLLLLREKAGAAKKTVALANCRGAVKQVLDIANFAKLFEIR